MMPGAPGCEKKTRILASLCIPIPFPLRRLLQAGNKDYCLWLMKREKL